MAKPVLGFGLASAALSAALLCGTLKASQALGSSATVIKAGHQSDKGTVAPSRPDTVRDTRPTAQPSKIPDLGLLAFVNNQAERLKGEPEPPLIAASSVPIPAARLEPESVSALAARCAPSTPTTALVSIARVESHLSPLAIRVNDARAQVLAPSNKAEAIAAARALITNGRNLDLGLAQINSRNLGWLNLSVEDAFDPCRNLAAAAQILDRGYSSALKIDRANRPLLQMAYSIYNTGVADRGWSNGYVAKIDAARRALDR
jgi:type IV secretion system protein VirB1